MKGFLYRKFMQFVHALGWHYAPPKEIINNEGYIDIIMWCEWCGLRSIMWHGTPNTACNGEKRRFVRYEKK